MRAPSSLVLLALLAMAPPSLALPLRAVPDAKQAQPPASVLPAPQRATYPQGTLDVQGLGLEVRGTTPELQRAARDLRAEFRTRLGHALDGAGRRIVIGTAADAELAGLARARGLATDRPEGYALWVDAQGAYVVGADAQGAYLGAQTLRQLLGPQGLRFAQISDWPALKTRMAMIYLDQYSQGVNDKLIPLLAQLKYNGVLVMSNYVQWDTARKGGFAHPGGASKAEAARVANLAREHGLNPVPLVETLGHVGWLFYGGKNADLQQDPASRNPFSYDTLNPRTYEVIEPILTEAVEVFKPNYVHIGHDEVRNQDRFPARDNGKAVGFEKLFVDDTVRLHGHLKQKGVGTMIWHDVAFADAFKDTIPARLPKDIVVTYWNYAPGDDYPMLTDIADRGFQVLGAPWRDPGNSEAMAKASVDRGMAGLLQTRWSGYFGNPSIIDGHAEQGQAYLRGATAWNPDGQTLANPAPRYFDLLNPGSYLPQAGRMVDLSSAVTRKLTDPDETAWIQKGPGTDLSALPTGEVRLGDWKFHVSGAVMLRGSRGAVRDLPDSVTLDIGAKADALAFLHATGWGNPKVREQIGAYELHYADGTMVRQPLEYGRHIQSWTEPVPTSMIQQPAWRGQTKEGLDVALGTLVVKNPHPDRVIRSVKVVSEGRAANPTLLGLTLLGGTP